MLETSILNCSGPVDSWSEQNLEGLELREGRSGGETHTLSRRAKAERRAINWKCLLCNSDQKFYGDFKIVGSEMPRNIKSRDFADDIIGGAFFPPFSAEHPSNFEAFTSIAEDQIRCASDNLLVP